MRLSPPRAPARARPPRPVLLSALLVALSALPLRAQDDGMELRKREISAGVQYDDDRWANYWEGTLRRDNENIGTITTRSTTLMAGYGVTERLSVHATLPYVRTASSVGILHGMRGFQDLGVAVRYRLLTAAVAGRGALTAAVTGAVGVPVTDYTPDFLPLSIGLGSRRLTGRGSLGYQANEGWFVNGSGGYTVRGNVRLDRPAYFTNDQLYLTDRVAMPDVFDASLAAGFRKGCLIVPLSLTQQRTLGGADIRRQDAPFVSNRMDFTRVGAAVDYTLPAPMLGFRAGVSKVVAGRNVGQSTTLSAGLHYMFQF